MELIVFWEQVQLLEVSVVEELFPLPPLAPPAAMGTASPMRTVPHVLQTAAAVRRDQHLLLQEVVEADLPAMAPGSGAWELRLIVPAALVPPAGAVRGYVVT